MLRTMLNGEKTRDAAGRCGPMKLKIDRGRLTGDRSCRYDGARMKTVVHGSVSQDRLVADETTYLVASTRPRQQDGIRVPEDDSLAKLYGERVGACTATNPSEHGQPPRQ